MGRFELYVFEVMGRVGLLLIILWPIGWWGRVNTLVPTQSTDTIWLMGIMGSVLWTGCRIVRLLGERVGRKDVKTQLKPRTANPGANGGDRDAVRAPKV